MEGLLELRYGDIKTVNSMYDPTLCVHVYVCMRTRARACCVCVCVGHLNSFCHLLGYKSFRLSNFVNLFGQ